MVGEPSVHRLRLWSGLIFLCVFLSGAVAGAGMYAWLRPRSARLPAPPAGALPPPLRELDLTPQQREQARAIWEKHRGTIEGLLQQTFPQVRAVHEQMEKELRAILTEAQAKKFDELRTRMPRPRGGPGFPGAPGGPRPPPGEGFGLPPPPEEGSHPPSPPEP